MCGIAGSIRWDGADDRAAVGAMTRALAHRGPDAERVVVSGPATLGHRRLAVIDVGHAADQPMQDEASGCWIVLNGEIYNYRDLRRELTADGCGFRTQSDTEVLLQGLVRHGPAFLGRLIGMFALAFWNPQRRELMLARDRLGKKPLYVQHGANAVLFASELSALRRHPLASNRLDPSALGHFAALGYTLTDRCVFAGVDKLPPAHFALIREGESFAPRSYWDLAAAFRTKARYRSADEAAEALGVLLDDAIRLRLVADVPLGAFLSGGVDSAAVVESMARLGNPGQIKTYTIDFDHQTFSEADAAAETARVLGVGNDARAADVDAPDSLVRAVGFCDEPFADTSMIPFFHLSAFARESVTVALGGDGGDELFAGYVTYVADRLQRFGRIVPSGIASLLRRGTDAVIRPRFGKVGFDYKLRQFLAGVALPPERAHYSWRTLFGDAERGELFRREHQLAAEADPFRSHAPHFAAVADCHWLDQAQYVDIKTWLVDDILVKADRMSMAHALEVRSPLLDHRLVEFAAALPPGWKLNGLRTKWLFRRYLRRRLPPAILGRPKTGFSAPVSHWLVGRMRALARAATESPALREWIDPVAIDRLWSEHENRRRDHGYRLFALVALGLWLDKTVSNPPSDTPAP